MNSSESNCDSYLAPWERELVNARRGMEVLVTTKSGEVFTFFGVREDSFVFQNVKGAAGSDTPDVLVLSMERYNDSIIYVLDVAHWTSKARS
jgi:hypothetical protein